MQAGKLLLVVGLFLVSSGCGSDGRLDLSGKVTLADGAPLARCRVIFRSLADGESFWGMSDEEGLYTAGSTADGPGIAEGKYAVTIAENRGDTDHPNPPKIHRKYSNPKFSGLQVDVTPENDTMDIVLDPPGNKKKR